MAITASGFFVQPIIDEFDATNTGFDWTLTSHKLFLLSDSATVNFDTAVSYASLSANEVTGTNWPAGGVLFSAAAAGGTSLAPTLTISPSGTMMWDWNDVSVANTTVSGAMALVGYADALTTPTADTLMILLDFITAATTNNGTLGVQFAASGVGAVDWTP